MCKNLDEDAICPWCGYKHDDLPFGASNEYDSQYFDDKREMYCCKCKGRFKVETITIQRYKTEKV